MNEDCGARLVLGLNMLSGNTAYVSSRIELSNDVNGPIISCEEFSADGVISALAKFISSDSQINNVYLDDILSALDPKGVHHLLQFIRTSVPVGWVISAKCLSLDAIVVPSEKKEVLVKKYAGVDFAGYIRRSASLAESNVNVVPLNSVLKAACIFFDQEMLGILFSAYGIKINKIDSSGGSIFISGIKAKLRSKGK